MNTVETIRSGIAYSHEILMATAEDLTTELTHWIPPGIANPISAIYAHALIEEDAWVGIPMDSAPLHESSFKGKTGISEIQNAITPEWAKSVEVNLERIGAYAEAVHATTKRYIDGLIDDDLDRMIDLSSIGEGEKPLGWLLGTVLINHTSWATGEISCLKGLQGERGYPF